MKRADMDHDSDAQDMKKMRGAWYESDGTISIDKDEMKSLLPSLPKVDLHVHLDGSLRISTIIELAQEYDIELPYNNEGELLVNVFKDQYTSLNDYLECFKVCGQVLKTAAALERVAYEIAHDCIKENIRYIEIRFAPQLHVSKDLCAKDAICAVDRGMARAQLEINNSINSHKALPPHFQYGIIVCALRGCENIESPYFDALKMVHADNPSADLDGLASLALIYTAIAARDSTKVVGIDLAGPEKEQRLDVHTKTFNLAHQAGFGITIHSGEETYSEHIKSTMQLFRPHRIGHGTHIFQSENIDGDSYDVTRLVSLGKTCLEVCLKSNLQTLPNLDIAQHPVGQMLKHKIPFVLCTDNRLVSHTTLTEELKLFIDNFDVDIDFLREMTKAGLQNGFLAVSGSEKEQYINEFMSCFDAVICTC